jgi:hypothetical protein
MQLKSHLWYFYRPMGISGPQNGSYKTMFSGNIPLSLASTLDHLYTILVPVPELLAKLCQIHIP